MKTRTLVRKHGWSPVDVDSMNITRNWPSDESHNYDHYNQIKEWCDQTVGQENYVATLQAVGARHMVKRFIFKNAKHATLFRMRWLTS